MTENKRFRYYEHKGADYILDNPNTELDFIEMLGDCLEAEEIVDLLNKQDVEIKRLKKENKKLYSKIFEMRTNRALEQTEISRQSYDGYKTGKEFLKELEKW